MTGTQWSGLAWSVRSSAEVSVHVSSHFFALNDRRDRQTELRTAAPWKSTTSIKQQKKEERLHSKRSPCKNRDGKIFATKCCQKHVRGGIAWLAMPSSHCEDQRPCSLWTRLASAHQHISTSAHQHIRINWSHVHHLASRVNATSTQHHLDELLERHSAMFG